jgi:hypothetical protein
MPQKNLYNNGLDCEYLGGFFFSISLPNRQLDAKLSLGLADPNS